MSLIAPQSDWSSLTSTSANCLKHGLRCDYLDGAPIALLGGRAKRAILPAPPADERSPQGKIPTTVRKILESTGI
jgi:hypothetical protein